MKNLAALPSKKKMHMWVLTSIVAASLIFFISAPKVFKENNILAGKIIVVDPGHGGVDGGANNKYILEKDVNLDIALKLRSKLEKRGAKVVMTREEDVDLGKTGKVDRNRYMKDLNARVDIINNSSACMFVSIHADSNPGSPRTRGMVALYSNAHPHNREMAKIFQSIFNSYGYKEKNNIYKSRHLPREGKYYILNHAKIPGVIIETGFITNSTDLYLLKKDEYREYVAEAIIMGITDYLEYSGRVPSLPSSQ